VAQMMPFIQAQRPVTILASGFPFKQHDNPLGWDQREHYRHTFRELISQLAGNLCSLDSAGRIDQRLARALPRALLAGVPSLRDILSSMVYSVPVPARAGTDPRRWACEVLAWPDGYTAPDLSPDLVSARRQVIASAWQDSVNYLAACLADAAAGVTRALSPACSACHRGLPAGLQRLFLPRWLHTVALARHRMPG
jgi:hypothetical protein